MEPKSPDWYFCLLRLPTEDTESRPGCFTRTISCRPVMLFRTASVRATMSTDCYSREVTSHCILITRRMQILQEQTASPSCGEVPSQASTAHTSCSIIRFRESVSSERTIALHRMAITSTVPQQTDNVLNHAKSKAA